MTTGSADALDKLQKMLPAPSIQGRYGPISNGGARGSALPSGYGRLSSGVAVLGIGVDGINTVGNFSSGQNAAGIQSGASAVLGTWGLFFPPAAVASAAGTFIVFTIDTIGDSYVDGLDRQGLDSQRKTDLITYQKALQQYKDAKDQLTKNACN